MNLAADMDGLPVEEPGVSDIPYGFCHCGCGEKTRISTQNDTRRGQVKGEPLRFIRHHQCRKPLTALWVDRLSGRWRITCRDGSRAYYYRAVMAAHLGRELRPDEVVHHINGDPADDRIENLQLTSHSEHAQMHNDDRLAARRARRRYEWSSHEPHCVECGSTNHRHRGHGLCQVCYSRNYHLRAKAA